MPLEEQSSNLTGLFEAQEVTPGVLPALPVWREVEPNSYSDFNGGFQTTQRTPLVHDRQHAPGDVSDSSPVSGFEEDLTPNNNTRRFQNFLYADARQKASSAPYNGVKIDITGVTASDDKFSAAAGLAVFKAHDIVLASGFANAANNGLHVVTAAIAASVTVASALVDEGAAASGMLETVGMEFPAGDATITVSANAVVITIDTAGVDFTTYGFFPGEWHQIGGDTAQSRFADTGNNAPFYARLKSVTALSLTYDKTTGVQETNVGAGKLIRLFFGTVIRNEHDCNLIKRRTSTFERQYGCPGGAVEADYVKGAAANQLTVTVPTPGANAKVTVAVTYVGKRFDDRISSEDLLSEVGTIVERLNEPCFKPGLDVYRNKLALLDDTTLNPIGIVSYNSELTLVVNNNVTGNKAVEVFGNNSHNLGEFTVTGTLNGYFIGVEAGRSIRLSKKGTWDMILTRANAGIVFDIPLLGLGGGNTSVEANQPVKIPLEHSAGKSKFGHTLLITCFRYLPTVAMATS